jgi:hypothetical protein
MDFREHSKNDGASPVPVVQGSVTASVAGDKFPNGERQSKRAGTRPALSKENRDRGSDQYFATTGAFDQLNL